MNDQVAFAICEPTRHRLRNYRHNIAYILVVQHRQDIAYIDADQTARFGQVTGG
jgi:hypothetical protein